MKSIPEMPLVVRKVATLERMIWFDDQVRRNRHPNASTLAEKFELSIKTAQRCIDAMRDRLNAPLEYNHCKKGWVYTNDSFQLPHFQVNPEEILAILLARNLLSKTAGGIISHAIGRFIEKLLVETGAIGLNAENIDRLFSATWTGHAPVQADVFRKAVQALLTSKLLSFTYASPVKDETSERTAEPHHLQYYMASWVLIAFCLDRNEWRKFYLSRMDQVQLLDAPFIPKPITEWENQVEGAFGIFQGKVTVTVVLHFSPFRARWIREQMWHPDQEMIPLADGGLELRLPVADFREIKMKILQFGADVTVVEPEELKKEIGEEIGKMGRLYPGL
jgi:predicted DNA-binding transcriptional regulator YafY